jgi:hypothetical protein
MTSKFALPAIALGYLGLLIAGPVAIMLWQPSRVEWLPSWKPWPAPPSSTPSD